MSGKDIYKIIKKAYGPVRKLSLWIKSISGNIGTPHILIYNCYSNKSNIFLTGAVMEERMLAKPLEDHSIWKNMRTMIRRYMGDVIPGVRVEIKAGDEELILVTDGKGIFQTVIAHETGKEIEHVECKLLDQLNESQGTSTAVASVNKIDPVTDFHIISDIDDTVLVSHSSRFFRKIRLMMLKNALTRSPFEGVSEFYRALLDSKVSAKTGERSIFYVSGSEWNLYDMLIDFFNDKNIPPGPLLLSDARIGLWSLFASGNTYMEKVKRIKGIFEHFTESDFLLIGDSGQKDPEIYMEIASMFPNRVKTIYIRVVGSNRKKRRMSRLVDEAKKTGIEMVWVEKTSEAMEHAAKKKYIQS